MIILLLLFVFCCSGPSNTWVYSCWSLLLHVLLCFFQNQASIVGSTEGVSGWSRLVDWRTLIDAKHWRKHWDNSGTSQITVFSHAGCLPPGIMERANHISIAMVDDIDSNGTRRSKVDAAVDQNKQACGSTVSFHNIHYKVQLKGGMVCRRKTSPKEILMDLKSVFQTTPNLFAIDFRWKVSRELFSLSRTAGFTLVGIKDHSN